MGSPCSDARAVDLHAHTTASDGDHTPTDLIRHAREKGLTALAVTDHDTIGGLEEALEAGRKFGVEVVPGVELSAQTEKGQCHLLGFFIQPDAPGLAGRLRLLRENRDNRNARMAARMREIGLNITLEEVAAVAGGEIIARPHFAKVLIAKGYADSVQDAFTRYLAEGAEAYVPKDKLTAEESIRLVHEAGGVVALAHPNNLKRDAEGTEAEIARLQALGLDGIEARYNLHTPEENARYLELAERRGLLTSGGSDFHGPTVKPKVFLGDVENGCPAPRRVLEALRDAAR